MSDLSMLFLVTNFLLLFWYFWITQYLCLVDGKVRRPRVYIFLQPCILLLKRCQETSSWSASDLSIKVVAERKVIRLSCRTKLDSLAFNVSEICIHFVRVLSASKDVQTCDNRSTRQHIFHIVGTHYCHF